MDYFEGRGDYPYRTNNIALPNRKVHKSAKGLPDIHVAMKSGRCCYVETKGCGHQSDKQIEFQEKVESRGHVYILAYNIQTVIDRMVLEDKKHVQQKNQIR